MKTLNLRFILTIPAISLVLACRGGDPGSSTSPTTPPLQAATVPDTPPPAPAANYYSTNFGLTENPIDEVGRWVGGKSVGLDWNNVQTAAGKAFAADLTGTPGRYSDPIAVLNTSFAPNQYAQGTVSRAYGYSPRDQHEIELLLRFQITAHSARGYEVLWAHTGGIAIVRWNSPLGSFTELANARIGAAINGDVLRAEIIGSVIRVYKNGALVLTGPSNTTWTDGQPGMGFWPLAGATLSSYGWKSFEAGSL